MTWTPERQRVAVRDANQRRAVRLKLEVIGAYGGGCQCCGEDDPAFLTVDHVGGREPQERGEAGVRLYRKIKLAGFPPRYRVLCFNCNCAIGAFGYCPHDEPPEERAELKAIVQALKAGSVDGSADPVT